MDHPALESFLPAVGQWFAESLGEPTPPQLLGWPPIRERKHTLILAPTGSGKTLAAFLVCIDELCRELARPEAWEPTRDPETGKKKKRGPMVLYVSPLKALNYDIERNLRRPLRGIAGAAGAMGSPIPRVDVAVRTGDTPQSERQRMLRHPPHILITTPESLHLMLTSRAREILRDVEYCIVDEIHSIADSKRGVSMSILLERLSANIGRTPTRIGLSATMRPLEAVAGFLGGQEWTDGELVPRPVEIVDAGQRRELDVRVVAPVQRTVAPEEGSPVWEPVYDRVYELIERHKSTIVFVNSRRMAERVAHALNERAGREVAYPHHGSVSAMLRREVEQQLKRGKIPAVVATGTLELGIDMGEVDLVVQVESPHSVARGLQRVGRAGHLMTSVSKGRIIPRQRTDLLEATVLAREMLDCQVEAIQMPSNCLDVLAQQLVAMVAVEDRNVDDLYRVVRQSHCYRELPREAFDGVVEMISGRYASDEWIDLRPRVSLNPTRRVLEALPGSQSVALIQGGTIPDSGMYRVTMVGSAATIGELEEEFVYESRVGDTFVLGTSAWRISRIDGEKVVVVPARGEVGNMPFWMGEFLSRDADFGLRMGAFVDEFARRAESASTMDEVLEWLTDEFPIDDNCARQLYEFIHEQHATGSFLPTDRRVIVERYRDTQHRPQLAMITFRGRRFHHTLRIALAGFIREKYGLEVGSAHSDDGLILHLPDIQSPVPLDILNRLSPDDLLELVLDELANSALFGLRFRHNAARALLLPSNKPGRRTPLWLQRLRSKDLLQIVKSHDGFPVVVETYRECLEDYLDVDGCRDFLRQVQEGEIEVAAQTRDTPSPFTESIVNSFTGEYMYATDAPPHLRHGAAQSRDREHLSDLLDRPELRRELDARALSQIDERLQGTGAGYCARTAAELYELIRRVGDLTTEEVLARSDPGGESLLRGLQADGRIVAVEAAGAREPRWIAAEEAAELRATLRQQGSEAPRALVARRLRQRAYLTPAGVSERYGIPPEQASGILEGLVSRGEAIRFGLDATPEEVRYAAPDHLESAYRITLSLARREAEPAAPHEYARFLMRWQHLDPRARLRGQQGLAEAIGQLQGLPLPAGIWETSVLRDRVRQYSSAWLDELCSGGIVAWQGFPGGSPTDGKAAFYRREHRGLYSPADVEPAEGDLQRRVRDVLRMRGPSFMGDIASELTAPADAVLQVLWDMVWRGEVAQDDYRSIRRGRPKPPSEEGSAASAVSPGRPSQVPPTAPAAMARWSLLPPGRLSSEALAEDDDLLESLAWLLLDRYGIMARGMLELERLPVTWGALYDTYQRMELRGQILRGYFVSELEGAQFALREAAQSLLAAQRQSEGGSPGEVVLVSSCDPANPYGSAGIWPTYGLDGKPVPFARQRQNFLVLRGGEPAMLLELAARRLTLLIAADEDSLPELLAPLESLCALPMPHRPTRRIQLYYLGGESIGGTAAEEALREIGFVSDGLGLVHTGTDRQAARTTDGSWPTPRRRGSGRRPGSPWPKDPRRRR